MKIDYKILGETIRARRKELRMTQERVAELIGISVIHMCNIENGKVKPSLQVFVNIMNALEVKADELLYKKSEES